VQNIFPIFKNSLACVVQFETLWHAEWHITFRTQPNSPLLSLFQ